MKLCKNCEIDKPFSEFHRYAKSVDGYQRWCKVCKKQNNSKRYDEQGNSIRQQNQTWKRSNQKKIRAFQKKYYSIESNRINRRLYNRHANRKRRAKIRDVNLEIIPQSFYDLLLIKQDNSCCYCRISFNDSPFPYEVEHMIPYERGGFNLRGNIQLSCKSCNSSKRDKLHEEYLAYMNGGE